MRRLAVLCLALTGCATATGSFPSRDWVAQLAEKPAPPKAAGRATRFVREWSMTHPGTGGYALLEAPAADVVAQRLATLAQTPGGKMTTDAGVACVASEVARFFDAHEGDASAEVMTFITTRCGLPTTEVWTTSIFWKAEQVQDDEQFARLALPEVDRLFTAARRDERQAMGSAMFRGKRVAIVVLASFSPRVELEPLPAQAEPGSTVVLRGRVLGPETELEASITRGEADWAACLSTVSAGRFEFQCPVGKDDQTARIDLFGRKKARVLGVTLAVLDLGVGTPLPRSLSLPDEKPRLLNEAASVSAALVSELNLKRAGVKRQPLIIEPGQERLADRVAPHLMSALKADPAQADLITLGMLAGWEVSGLVEGGGMNVVTVPPGGDVQEVVRTIMASPTGRERVLNERTNRIAVGSVRDEEGSAAVFLYSYQVVLAWAPEADVAKVKSTVNQARAKAGVPPLAWNDGAATLCIEAAKDFAGQVAEPGDALDSLGGLVRNRGQYGSSLISGLSSEGELAVDPSLLDPALTQMGLTIFYVRPPNEPWARRLVLFYFPMGGGQVALGPAPDLTRG
ncbi:MAG: CAP domain-containing protein [Myxococcaceae bacterium]